MAHVTTKTAEVKYVLEMTKREAEALTELLVVADESEGEGEFLGNVYAALCEAGCESFDTSIKRGVNDRVVVYRHKDA